ncbi:MAG: hypothetical protein HKP52_06945 [Desulfofustis sp.]|nr:hypothetical protein [Desulfofustis sp.]
MKVTKKLIACLLVICMFLRLPKAEAIAADAVDDFITTTISLDYQRGDFKQSDCSGIYTILSPCYKDTLVFYDIDRDGAVELDEDHAYEQQHSLDDNDMLPWNDVSEPPQVGVMMPILHF